MLAHLIAAQDGMIKLFGAGKQAFGHYYTPFIKTPDKSGQKIPPVAELMADWKTSCEMLSGIFSEMSDKNWLSRHTMVSEEDFLKEPHRNKLNVLLSRTNHLAYHLGQMRLIK